jgi:hypothetical protein
MRYTLLVHRAGTLVGAFRIGVAAAWNRRMSAALIGPHESVVPALLSSHASGEPLVQVPP